MPSHVLKVPADNEKQRLDIFLTQNIAGDPSRTRIKHWIAEGFVTVNQATVKPNHKIRPGDDIRIEIPETDDSQDIEPEEMALDVIYEDDCLVVINKPAGMLVHPTASCRTGTLVNALLHRYERLSTVNANFRPGIVHRLDRETSGVIVVAKDDRTHVRLAREFEKHRVKKKYIAWVKGVLEFDEGVIDAALDRHPIYFDKRAVGYHETARSAKTFYRVLRRTDECMTLVGLYPTTGRTHQLRVHMAYLGHPILGDDKYGTASSFSRLALHAQGIAFRHPTTKKIIEFSVIPPAEFMLS